MADNQDIEDKIILNKDGNLTRIRTDRERYEENSQNEQPKYDKNAQISLEQVYDHIKPHYRKDTNCISLSSNANVSISYGRGFYKDRYIMVKVPKNEMGEKVINAGQYMLEEIEKKINEYISHANIDNKLEKALFQIDNSKTIDEFREILETTFTSKEKLNPHKAKLRNGIKYKLPVSIISNYQALNEEQSLELIHYGDIRKEEIIDIPKEIVDIFAILQQTEGQDIQIIIDLKKQIVRFIRDLMK